MKKLRALILILIGSCAISVAVAVEDATAPLRVGVKVAPPFVIKDPDGSFTGISVDLWRGVAEVLQVAYELHETDLSGLLDGLRSNNIDVAVAALTVTTEREHDIDFSHPFYISGLGIATNHQGRASLWSMVGAVFTVQFFKTLVALGLVLFLVGLVIWLLERHRNPDQFGGNAAQGLGSGFWWSAVTMTTVGYGDKAPLTASGRAVAVIWMFASVITISGFTAAIASAFTAERLASRVNGPQDLPGAVVATVRDSTSSAYLQQRRLNYLALESPAAALDAVATGQAEVAVYDAPLLKFLVNSDYQGVVDVLPLTFERQDYALAFPAGSPLREAVNRALLSRIGSAVWQDTLYRYLGGQ